MPRTERTKRYMGLDGRGTHSPRRPGPRRLHQKGGEALCQRRSTLQLRTYGYPCDSAPAHHRGGGLHQHTLRAAGLTPGGTGHTVNGTRAKADARNFLPLMVVTHDPLAVRFRYKSGQRRQVRLLPGVLRRSLKVNVNDNQSMRVDTRLGFAADYGTAQGTVPKRRCPTEHKWCSAPAVRPAFFSPYSGV